MTETVTVRSASGTDSNGDPITAGPALTLTPLEVAPGNTARVLGDDGALDTAEFTLYFGLRSKVAGAWLATDAVVRDDYTVVVRGRDCFARVLKWESGGLGGVVVLCKSASGRS